MRWKEIPIYIQIPVYIFMLLLAFMTLAPFLYFISLSFSKYKETFEVFLWPTSFEWQNYVEAWKTIKIGVYYRNSLYVAVLALISNLAIGSMAAYSFARYKVRGREVLFNLFLAGLILSSESLIIPLFLGARFLGIFNKWWTLPVIYTTLGLPFTILVMRTFFETIPSEIIDAATIDGCNAIQLFRHIMMPLSRAALLTVGLFQLIWYWDEFILAISMITDEKIRTLPGGMAYLMGEYYANYPVIAAALVLIVIPVIVVYILTQRQLIRGMTMGALK
jgi:raffinose/stachyose/melibiose transport system permease protein